MTRHPARPAIAAGALLVVLLGAFVYALLAAQSTTREDVAQRFSERAGLSAAITDSVLLSSASGGGATYAKRFGAPKVTARSLDAWQRLSRSEGLVLLDEGGVIAAAHRTPSAFISALRARPAWLRGALRGAPYGLSDVIDVPGRRPVVGFAQPFETPSGQRVIVSAIRPSDLAKFFAGYLGQAPNHGGQAYVLDAAGTVIGASSGETRVPEPGLLDAIARGSSGAFGDRWFASRPIAGSDWRLVLTSSADDLFVSVSGARKWLPWAIILAFGVVALVAFSLLRRGQRRSADLRQIQERYALVVEGSNDGIWDHDLRTDRFYFSPRWKSILGLDGVALPEVKESWLERVHPDDVQGLRQAATDHVEGRTPSLEFEHRVRHADGDWRWVLIRGTVKREADGTRARMAGSMSDITARKLAEERLRRDALHDELTGLPNRSLFLDRLGVSLGKATRIPDHRSAVLFLDLDRFKLINDSFSHAIGDELLVEVGRRLSALLRPGDTVARLGGDEFTVLLDDVGTTTAPAEVARRILDALAQPMQVQNRRVIVGVSVGIALSGLGATPAEMLRNADIAMYEAKRQGRNRFAVYTDDLHEDVTERLHLEMELRSAIEDRRLRVAYQPLVDLATGRLTGFEALARWPESADGAAEITPDRFIPVAEETGLISDLGQLVLTTACHQLAEWRASGVVAQDVAMSVNVAGVQLEEPDRLTADVRAALQDSGLPASALRLEITESSLVSEPGRLDAALATLAELGVGAHIDDFGTGYSSLTLLQHFPGDTLKIDRSFISSMHVDEGHHEIVRAIVSLAHNLGLETVAEGIDNPHQLELLRSMGCRHGQGFLFARPLYPEAVATLVASWRDGRVDLMVAAR